jgi:glutamine synthetase adenylyltransferase
MLRLTPRDLNGLATLDEVMATITTLADIALTVAVDHLTRIRATSRRTDGGQ